MHTSNIYFLIIFLSGYIDSSIPDDALPVYLRGMNWNNVREHLKQDLRLSDAVIPKRYKLQLSVNLRGYGIHSRSNFHGFVSICMTIVKPVDKIELHSNGLNIQTAKTIDSNRRVVSLVSKITTNLERETVTIHFISTLVPQENLMLRLFYFGEANMNEYGLYESWDPKFNKSVDSNGPFVLASRNFPTGARFWFPCFDEPQFKAKFDLEISHWNGLNVYSNTRIKKSEDDILNRTLTVFETSGPLSTYQVALSINHLSSEPLDVKEFGKNRLIKSNNSHEDYSFPCYPSEPNDCANNVSSFLIRSLERFRELDFVELPTRKIDIILLEATSITSIQPGLITVGRYNLWNRNLPLIASGISVNNSNEMWLNDMFSYILMNQTVSESSDDVSDQVLHSSLHEIPLRHTTTYSTTTKQYLASRRQLPSLKAFHLIKLIVRFCPRSTQALKNYIASHIGGFASIDDFIGTASKSCEDPGIAREFLEDFINQPGKALFSMRRNVDSVIIEQTRYHSTYFNPALRDNTTRYTIPIFFAIDGKSDAKVFLKNQTSLTIKVPEHSLFLIDDQYDHLYFAYYHDIIIPKRNYSEDERRRVFTTLRKSMVAAASIGFVNYSRINNDIMHYTKERIFVGSESLEIILRSQPFLIKARRFGADIDDTNEIFHDDCKPDNGYRPTWNEWFNEDSRYWQEPCSERIFTDKTHCVAQWNEPALYLRFLEENFLGERSKIRPNLMPTLAHRDRLGTSQWRTLHRFFLQNVANFTDDRINLLADTVLNQATAGSGILWDYPNEKIRDDYLKEASLRNFVLRNPVRAASMSTEIETRLEREYIRVELPKFHDTDWQKLEREYNELGARLR